MRLNELEPCCGSIMSMNLLLTIVIIYNWFIVNSVTVLIRKKRIYKREISSLLFLTQSTLTAIAQFLIPVCCQPQHQKLNNQACSFSLVIPKGNWEIWIMPTVYLKSFLTFFFYRIGHLIITDLRVDQFYRCQNWYVIYNSNFLWA